MAYVTFLYGNNETEFSKKLHVVPRGCKQPARKRGIGPTITCGPHSLGSYAAAKWSWGCVSAIDSNGRTNWIAEAHRGAVSLVRFR